MRRLALLAVLAVVLAACGGSGASTDGGSGGSKGPVKITFGRSGGTMVPESVTIAPGGTLTVQGWPDVTKSITSAVDARLSGLVRKDLPSLKSEQCPGSFPDESGQYITALGKTVRVRGACEPGFTTLWNSLAAEAGVLHL